MPVQAEAQTESKSQNQSFKIKVDGQEIEVTQDELIKLAQEGKDYTKKTQALAEERKALKAEAEKVAQMKSIVDEMDADPKLKEALNKAYADVKAGKVPKPEITDRNLKLIDKRIAEATDPAVKQDLMEIKEIITQNAEEIAERIASEKLAKVQEELATLRNATKIGHTERVEAQISKLEEKYGADIVSKYKQDILNLSLKYPHQSVQKLLYNCADETEIETAIVNNAKKKEKEELDRKKRNASPSAGEGSYAAKTELVRDKMGRVTSSSLMQRIKERLGRA